MDTVTPEVRNFLLEGTRTAKLATVRADGRPHVVPVWFELDENNTLIFTTGDTTVKVHNMQRDPHVCICVEDDKPPYSFAMLEGTATLSEDMEAMKYWATRIAGRYMGQDKAEAYGARNAVPGELLVRVTLTRVIFAKDIAS